MKNKSKEKAAIVVTSHFKMIFRAIVFLTVLMFVSYIWIAIHYAQPTDQMKTVLETLSSGWKTGSGVIFGLVAGKRA